MKSTPSERGIAAFVVLGTVAATTWIGAWMEANSATAGFLLLLAVLFLTLRLGLFAGVLAAILGSAAFNFYFLLPLHTFTVSDPANWAALAAFGITALVTGRLVAAERRRAEEAEARRREITTLYELCFGLFASTNRPGHLDEAASRTLAALEARRGGLVLMDRSIPRCVWAKGEPTTIADEPGVLEAIRSEAVVELESGDGPRRQAAPLAVGGRTSGALVVAGGRTDPKILASAGRLLALAIERDRLIEESTRLEATAASDRLKTAMLRAVSHDLRSPLTAMGVGLEALLRSAAPGSTERERILSVAREQERLARRVDQLLTAARLEAGLLRPHFEPIPAAELLRAAMGHLELALADRPVDVVIAPDCPDVLTDAALTIEALVNLIENAARLAPRASGLLLSATLASDHRVALEVADRGPGLPTAFTASGVQAAFGSAHGVEAEGGRGGLGLAIVRDLVAACRGALELADRPGGGASVRILLPEFLHAAPAFAEIQE
ncbi:MAG: DUF4118 domain-containing protein [Thermoanaerobaculia bacterium]